MHPPDKPGAAGERGPLRFAVICASNQNRSMEAHELMSKSGLDVQSYGTNSQIKIPGVAASKPNVYAFGTSYEHIRRDLESQDAAFYRAQGLLDMVERNARVKEAPERFQDAEMNFDILITCEDRCWEIVVDHLLRKSPQYPVRPVHVIGFHIPDTRQNAAAGARRIAAFAERLAGTADLDNQISAEVERASQSDMLLSYCVQYY